MRGTARTLALKVMPAKSLIKLELSIAVVSIAAKWVTFPLIVLSQQGIRPVITVAKMDILQKNVLILAPLSECDR